MCKDTMYAINKKKKNVFIEAFASFHMQSEKSSDIVLNFATTDADLPI